MIWKIRLRSKMDNLTAITEGIGPSVTLLHGVGLNADAWGGQIEALANYFTVKAFDMPGHGESPELATAYPKLNDYVAAMKRHINEPTVVVGHSMGAMVALKLAKKKEVVGVVALNAVFQRSPSAHDAVQKRAQQLKLSKNIDPKPTLSRWFEDQTSLEAKMCDRWLRHVSIDGYRAAYNVFAQENGPTAQELYALNKPALFMTGGLELNSTADMSTQMANLCEMGNTVILENAGHMMPMTHYKNVNRHLIKFIKHCHRKTV